MFVPMKYCGHAYQQAHILASQSAIGEFPVDVQSIVERSTKHSIRLISADQYQKYQEKHRLVAIRPRYARTFYDPQKNIYMILYNEKLPIVDVRYSIAHELGHIFLGHFTNSEDSSAHPHDYQRMEIQANVFAGNLLAPPILMGCFFQDSYYQSDLVAQQFGIPLAEAKRNRRWDYEYWSLRRKLSGYEISMLHHIAKLGWFERMPSFSVWQ